MSLHTSEEECVSDSIGLGVHMYISYMYIYNILYNDLLYYEEKNLDYRSWVWWRESYFKSCDERRPLWEDDISFKLWIERSQQCKLYVKSTPRRVNSQMWMCCAHSKTRKKQVRLEWKLTSAKWDWKWRKRPDRVGLHKGRWDLLSSADVHFTLSSSAAIILLNPNEFEFPYSLCLGVFKGSHGSYNLRFGQDWVCLPFMFYYYLANTIKTSNNGPTH